MRIFVVDAFSDTAFRGNPAAVCLLEEPAEPALLQSIAAEMNLSETAFVAVGEEEPSLRWFTPTVEVDLCGHATLASAAVLWRAGLREGPIRFRTRSGQLVASPRGTSIELDFPALPAVSAAPPEGLLEALGVRPLAVMSSRTDWFVEVASAEEVRSLRPDLGALAAAAPHTVVVTAAEPGGVADFVSRVFAPAIGVAEDPVTGAAHCVLGPYWGARLGRDELVGFQASPRGGFVRLRLAGERVVLSGAAVIVLAGEFSPEGDALSR